VQQRFHGHAAERLLAVDQHAQRLLDARFALVRGQMQNLQILPIGPRRQRLVEQVVGQAESTAGEQFLAVAIIRQRSRLADQRVDHMPVIDVPLAAAVQPRQRGHLLLGVPHFQMLQVDAHLDPLADQSAVHRIGVVLHVDDAAVRYGHHQPFAGLQPACRQRSQHRLFLGQSFGAWPIPVPANVVQERLVIDGAGKVSTTTQEQRLLHGVFEMPVRRLGIAIFVGLPRLDLLAHQAVMFQQALVTFREVASLRQIVHRTAHPVATMPLGYATQLPQRVLQAHTQALEALRKAERHRLPIRVGQHEVIDQMPRDGHVQTVHVREVRSAQPARMMNLAEVYLPPGPVRGPPLLDAPLQRPQLSLVKPSRILPQKPIPQGLGLELGRLLQLRGHFRPDLGERIQFAGKPLHDPIPSCRLSIDTCQARRLAQTFALGQQTKQPPHMDIRNLSHRKLLVCWNLR
jgi:hypothetical protein